MYCTNSVLKNDICHYNIIDTCHDDIYVIWYTCVQMMCTCVVQNNCCVVYGFEVAKSIYVDDSSHVYAHYSLYMSCIFFLIFHIIFALMIYTPRSSYPIMYWSKVVISGTVHWFDLKTSFHPLLWTSSGLRGTWKLSAYIGFPNTFPLSRLTVTPKTN